MITSTRARTALALVLAAAVAGGVVPAYAQPAPDRPAIETHTDRFERHGPGGMQRRGEFLDFLRGPEALEIAFVRLAYAVDLTADQQALFETLRTDALAAQEAFTAATVDLRPTAEGEPPAMADRLANRIALERARLDALEAVQPAYEAFFSALTEDQLQSLQLRRGPHRPEGTTQS